jgi:Flp pilus assembly pilin Flp
VKVKEVEMRRQSKRPPRRGQSLLEYALMIVVLLAVIIAMNVYFKRGLQGRWKQTTDQIGEQFTTRPGTNVAIQTNQISSRVEATGTDGEVKVNNWTRSSISGKMPTSMTSAGIGGLGGTYAGHETTVTDYVKATVGTKTATHSAFDSGQLSNVKLFNDD